MAIAGFRTHADFHRRAPSPPGAAATGARALKFTFTELFNHCTKMKGAFHYGRASGLIDSFSPSESKSDNQRALAPLFSLFATAGRTEACIR